VELISGVRIRGKVAWSLGTQTGVVFSEPLAATHPVVLDLARRARRLLAEQSQSIAGALHQSA
jgi:hypothetical protein